MVLHTGISPTHAKLVAPIRHTVTAAVLLTRAWSGVDRAVKSRQLRVCPHASNPQCYGRTAVEAALLLAGNGATANRLDVVPCSSWRLTIAS